MVSALKEHPVLAGVEKKGFPASAASLALTVFNCEYGGLIDKAAERKDGIAAGFAPDEPYMEVIAPDAAYDPRFREAAAVAGPPYIRFFASFPVGDAGEYRLYVADKKPRAALSLREKDIMRGLCNLVAEYV